MKEQLFYLSYGGFYFRSTLKKVELAEALINYELARYGFMTMNSVLAKFGVGPCPGLDDIGWVKCQMRFELFSDKTSGEPLTQIVFACSDSEFDADIRKHYWYDRIEYLKKQIESEEKNCIKEFGA